MKNNIKSFIINRTYPIFIVDDDKKYKIFDFIDRKIAEQPNDKPGEVNLNIVFKKEKLQIADDNQIGIDGIRINYYVFTSEDILEINSAKIAKLILARLSHKQRYH